MSQSQPPTPSKGMPKWLKRSLWGLGFFFALLVLAWVILYFVANSQLENTLESLRKGGYATRLEEMAPPPVPDAQGSLQETA